MQPTFGAPPVVDDPTAVVPVVVVIGTRPEAIKMLPLVRALRDHPRLDAFVVSTGQHPGMVESVLALDGLEVDADLGVGRPGLTLNHLFAAVLEGLEALLFERFGPPAASVNDVDADSYPVAVLVHGDTSSAAAAALGAFHLRIPVVHIEAGLRTRSTLSPFPEELNRQLIARVAAFHLAPTERNEQNLVHERVDVEQVFVTGNTGIDALRWAAARREPYGVPELADLEHDEFTRVVTVTAHRRENWGAGLRRISEAVHLLAESYPDVRFVVPVHPNPRVAEVLREALADLPNLSLVAPMEYLAFARLLARSTLVITDSGGIQEEAPALDVPVLVTRTTTERDEGLEAGTLGFVGIDPEVIVGAARRLLDDRVRHAQVAARTNPYGDGHAVGRILAAFEHLVFDAPAPAAFGSGFSRGVVLDAAGYDRVSSVQTIPAPGRGIASEGDQAPLEDVAIR